MRSKLFWIAALVAAPVIGGGGCTYNEHDHDHHRPRYREEAIHYRDRYDRPHYHDHYRHREWDCD